jgi:hypothetical protein
MQKAVYCQRIKRICRILIYTEVSKYIKWLQLQREIHTYDMTLLFIYFSNTIA